MRGHLPRVLLVAAAVGILVCRGCDDTGAGAVDDKSLQDSLGFDSRAIVVLGYLDHRQGLVATVKWPRVAFAIGDGTLLLTAAHCVVDFEGSSRQAVSTDIVVVSPYYGDAFDFDIVAIDKQADVAILRAPWRSHPAFALATERELLAAKSLLIAGRPQSGRISGDLRTELLPVAGVDESVPGRAISLKGTRLVVPGWSGSAMLVPGTNRVAGILTQLSRRSVERGWFFRSSRSTAMGCSIRPILSLLREHGLETAALGRPADVEAIPDAEHAFSLVMSYFQGLWEKDQDKYKTAARELTRLRPDSVQAHLLAAAVTLVAEGDARSPTTEQFDLAESSYQRALEIDPNHAHAHASYGSLLLAQGRSAEALAQCDAALAADPNDRLALFNRLALIPPAQYRAAAERLVAVDPNNPLYWFHYGDALLRLGEMDAALQAARKAVDLDPNGLFYGGLANVLAGLGRLDEAEPFYKRMTERCGCDSCWYRYAGFLAEHREGKHAEAMEALRTAESKNQSGRVRPRDIEMLRMQLLEKTSPEEAETLGRQLLQADPNDAQCWWRLAGVLRTLTKYPEAVDAAERAVKLDPNASYRPRLASCLTKASRLDDAQKTYDEMFRLHPDRGRYWCWYTGFLVDYFPERQDEARLALEKAQAAADKRWAASPDEIRQLQERLDAKGVMDDAD
jgi:tetratricopeptide (TPR) repeat protein